MDASIGDFVELIDSGMLHHCRRTFGEYENTRPEDGGSNVDADIILADIMV